MSTLSPDLYLKSARASARRVALADALSALPVGTGAAAYHALQALQDEAIRAEAAALEPLLAYCGEAIDRFRATPPVVCRLNGRGGFVA